MDAKIRILVIDDNETVRRSLSRSLTSAQRSVEVASDGTQAIRAMEAQPFDVILLDLRMPGLDGMTVLKIIKRRWPESEVVVITGYPTIETAVAAVRLGAFDYLAKPVGPDEVITVADCATMQKKWALRPERSVQSGGTVTGTSQRESTSYFH